MSVFAAVTATHIKIPAEKSLLSHVQYVRELLDRKIIDALLWFDTRDMTADAHTKGIISRELLLRSMKGDYWESHPVKTYSPLTNNSHA